MSVLRRGSRRLHYQWSGNAQSERVLVLSHSLGTHLDIWTGQTKALGERFHILTYDHPGHGLSDPLPAGSSLSDLGQEVLSLIDSERLSRVDFCGFSLGGMIGLWLAINASSRLNRLAISNCSACIENKELLRQRIDTLQRHDIKDIAEDVIRKWLSADWCKQNPRKLAQIRQQLLGMHAKNYAQVAQIVCEADLRPGLPFITTPTLVLYGAHDEATPPSWNQAIAAHIPGAQLKALDAAHLSNIEASDDFNKALEHFLKEPQQTLANTSR